VKLNEDSPYDASWPRISVIRECQRQVSHTMGKPLETHCIAVTGLDVLADMCDDIGNS